MRYKTLARALLLVALIGCEDAQMLKPLTQTQAPSQAIPIGVIVSQTGRLETLVGVSLQRGYELARDELNQDTEKFRLLIEDDQSTLEGAVEAFEKLVNQEGVSFLLGPIRSDQAEILFPMADAKQVIAQSSFCVAGLSELSDYAFRVALTTDILIPRGIDVTQEKLGYKTAATLYDKADLFSTDADAAVREKLAANGVEILNTQTFQSGDTKFDIQLARILVQRPDVIFVSSLPPEKFSILTQAHEMDVSAPFDMHGPFIVRTLTAGDVQAAGEAAEGAMTFVGWSSAIDTPKNKNFVESYTAKYGVAPNNFAAQAYATLHILAAAIQEAGTSDVTAVQDTLANTQDLDTIFGKFAFDANGDAVYDAKILIVKDGELVPFDASVFHENPFLFQRTLDILFPLESPITTPTEKVWEVMGREAQRQKKIFMRTLALDAESPGYFGTPEQAEQMKQDVLRKLNGVPIEDYDMLAVAKQFYTKYIDAGGVAIVADEAVNDVDLMEARRVVLTMTLKHPELRDGLTLEHNFYMMLIGRKTSFWDVPELHSGRTMDGCVIARYNYGFCFARVSDPLEIFAHEFGHALDNEMQRFDPTFEARVTQASERARELGIYQGIMRTYPWYEYWADGLELWFYEIGRGRMFETYDAFFRHDPPLAELFDEWFPRVSMRF